MNFIFSPKDDTTITEIKIKIREMVSNYISNIEIQDVVTEETEKTDTEFNYGIVIYIYYRVITTGRQDYIKIDLT